MPRVRNSTKAIVMGKLLLASLCDCTQDNTEQFKRYFTAPAFDVKTGHVEIKSVRKKHDGRLELVTWEAIITMREVKSQPLDTPIGPVPEDQLGPVPTDG